MTNEKWPPRACNAEAALRFIHADDIPLFAMPRREAELLRAELAMGGVAGAYAQQYLTRMRGRRATLGELARVMRQMRQECRDWGSR